MKYVLCVYYIGICVFILIYFCKEKEIGEVIRIALLWAAGLIMASIPAIIYFAANNALSDLWHVYGYNMIFHYEANKASVSYLMLYILLIIWGFVIFIISGLVLNKINFLNKQDKKLLTILMVSLIIYVVLFACKVKYVLIVFMSIFDVLFMGYMKLSEKYILNISKKKIGLLLIGFILLVVPLSIFFSDNTSSIGRKKESYVQYDFAEIINREKDKTLMVYNNYEIGFYLTTNTLPNIKYFNDYSINIYEINDTMNNYINNKDVNFVITYNDVDEECDDKTYDFLSSNYYVIEKKEYVNNNYNKIYYLWKKRDK